MGPKRPNNKPRKGARDRIEAKTTMAERHRLFSECSEETCSLCWNEISVFAVGSCNHPVCHQCLTRMRVLCSQKDCAICRQDMPKIIFCRSRCCFDDMANKVMPMDKKYQICFEDETVKKYFDDLLMHKCPLCPQEPYPVSFRSFRQLDTHVRREHERFYCELCVSSLKNFSHERKLYSRTELATHRRKGDPDDSSHKGHPLCQFCEVRFVDDEELFRHLRRDHFFCHFCDADGVQAYYPSYPMLKEHFKTDHYLCEDGACVNEQFTHAFRTELDLKAHRLDRHSDGLSKNETRLNRLVGIDVSYSRHNERNRHNERERETTEAPVTSKAEAKLPDMSNDFPTLGGASKSGTASASANPNSMANRLALNSRRNVQSWATGMGNGNLRDQDFPSLPGQQPQPPAATVTRPFNSGPSNPPSTNLKKNGKTNHNNNHGPAQDFPSLPSSNNNVHAFGVPKVYKNPNGYTPAWSASGPSKEKESKGKTVAPAPDLDFPDLNDMKTELPSSKPKKGKKKVKATPAENDPPKNTNMNGGLKSAADLVFREETKAVVASPEVKKPVHNDPPKPKTEKPKVMMENTRVAEPAKRRPAAPPPGFAKSKKFKYMEAPDFQQRNLNLQQTICSAFKGAKSLEFAMFKKHSIQFKENRIDAKQYIDEIGKLVDNGHHDLDGFMPELITLLPNIEKQQQLVQSYTENFSDSKVLGFLHSCEKCGQIIAKSDRSGHGKAHEIESEFPAL